MAVLAGDGIGPEVIPDAVASLDDRFEIVPIDAGAERYLVTGEPIGDEQVRLIADSDALLFGAVGDPRVPDGVLERGVILRLRKELDLYVNLRPFPELGIVFVRENTEGPYSGEGGRVAGVATELNINTVLGVSRCVRYAYELASTRSRRLTLVHKSNVLRYAGGLWKDVVADVGRDFPDVDVAYEHADAAAYHLVTDASRFDVVVTDNLFGDILSDLAAGLSGGLGKAASANLHPDPSTRPTTCLGMFEPVHGSAPDIAGRGKADSTAAIRAAEMLMMALPAEAHAG